MTTTEQVRTAQPSGGAGEKINGFGVFSADLMAVMQEMIKSEVKSYMEGLSEQRGRRCFQEAKAGGIKNVSF